MRGMRGRVLSVVILRGPPDWSFRRRILKRELLYYKSDVVCLQEVQAPHDWESPESSMDCSNHLLFFVKFMTRAGYDFVYCRKIGAGGRVLSRGGENIQPSFLLIIACFSVTDCSRRVLLALESGPSVYCVLSLVLWGVVRYFVGPQLGNVIFWKKSVFEPLRKVCCLHFLLLLCCIISASLLLRRKSEVVVLFLTVLLLLVFLLLPHHQIEVPLADEMMNLAHQPKDRSALGRGYNQVALFMLLRHLATGRDILIGTTHITANWSVAIFFLLPLSSTYCDFTFPLELCFLIFPPSLSMLTSFFLCCVVFSPFTGKSRTSSCCKYMAVPRPWRAFERKWVPMSPPFWLGTLTALQKLPPMNFYLQDRSPPPISRVSLRFEWLDPE